MYLHTHGLMGLSDKKWVNGGESTRPSTNLWAVNHPFVSRETRRARLQNNNYKQVISVWTGVHINNLGASLQVDMNKQVSGMEKSW